MKTNKILEIIQKEKINFLYLQFSDLFGQPKNVVIPINKFDDVLESGLWFDGSSIEGFARIAESDMLLTPDLSTFALVPWTDGQRKAARLICDLYKPDGQRLGADPRRILQKILNKAAKIGFSFIVGAEFEFYLIERGRLPKIVPHDYKSYFDYTPHSRASAICEKTIQSLSALGIPCEMHHHEVGKGQHEIDLKYDKALKVADNIMTLKIALKAHTAGTELKATWMPKPIFGAPGNGLHLHQSLWKGNKNLFYDPKSEFGLSNLAICFLAGQLAHAKALSAIVSPTVNSYKRLVSGYEAPVYVCWGCHNRSALIRVPKVSPSKANQASRIEYRAPDPSANPYLAMAGLLAAGLDGIRMKLNPPKPVGDNVYEFTPEILAQNNIPTLPTSLIEAISELEKDNIVNSSLDAKVSRFLEIKRQEWQQFATQVTSWEVKRYL